MDDNVLIRILEYAWVGLFAMVAWIMKKLSLHDTNIKLLEQVQAQNAKTRDEDMERNTADHDKIIKLLDGLAAKHK